MALVVASIAISGSYLTYRTYAAASMLYVSPAKLTATLGNTVVVPVRINSNADTVNAVQVNLTYPASQLKFISVENATGAFPLMAQTTNSNGTLTVAVATQGGQPAVSGDKLVMNVSFQAIGSGTANVGIAGSSLALSSVTNTNILGSYVGGQIAIPKARGKR